MLQNVLQNAPDNWEQADYTRKSFVLKEVSFGSFEYDVRFIGWGVEESALPYKLYRVQNPFSHGRFALWREQISAEENIQINWNQEFYKMATSLTDISIIDNYEKRNTAISYTTKTSVRDCLPLGRGDVIHVVTHFSLREDRNKERYPEYVISTEELTDSNTATLSDSGDLDDMILNFYKNL